MEMQRLEVVEDQIERLERRVRGVVAGWILSIIGMLMFGLMVRSAWSTPALPPEMVVRGIKVVDEQGRERASIDAKGDIRGSLIKGDALWIGTSSSGTPLFTISVLAVPHGHAITRMELASPGLSSAGFRVWASAGADNQLTLGHGRDYVRLTPDGIEVRRGGGTVWHAP